MKTKRVLITGWDPTVVDYSKWPGLTAEKLTAAIASDKAALIDLGCEVEVHLIKSEETAPTFIEDVLSRSSFDFVMIGAGVRTIPDYIFLFEKLVNVAHRCAPQANICFNTGPYDSAAAVQRWM